MGSAQHRAELVAALIRRTVAAARVAWQCLVPATGFHEWKKGKRAKQPYHAPVKDTPVFAFAGLWERWDKGEPIERFTIIVTAANDALRPIHDRMPVILAPADHEAWLDADATPRDETNKLLRPLPSNRIAADRVNTQVNQPTNDDASLVEPVHA